MTFFLTCWDRESLKDIVATDIAVVVTSTFLWLSFDFFPMMMITTRLVSKKKERKNFGKDIDQQKRSANKRKRPEFLYN